MLPPRFSLTPFSPKVIKKPIIKAHRLPPPPTTSKVSLTFRMSSLWYWTPPGPSTVKTNSSHLSFPLSYVGTSHLRHRCHLLFPFLSLLSESSTIGDFSLSCRAMLREEIAIEVLAASRPCLCCPFCLIAHPVAICMII